MGQQKIVLCNVLGGVLGEVAPKKWHCSSSWKLEEGLAVSGILMKFLEFWRRVERCGGGGNHLCILQCLGGAGKLIGPPLSTFLEKYLMFPPPPPPPLPPRCLEKRKELAEEEKEVFSWKCLMWTWAFFPFSTRRSNQNRPADPTNSATARVS